MRLRHLLLASLAVPVSPGFAQDEMAGQVASVAASEETIVVTGTRRTDRTVLESAVPVDVFTADDFKAQPAPQLQTIL